MNLYPGEVHIWSASIDERYEKLLSNSFLSENEKRRARKYAYDIDAFLFAVRHNLLRIILGRYLNDSPAGIRFKSNRFKKPYIVHPITPIHFNISYSSNRFVAAFCLDHPIGVDIELIRQVEDIQQLTTGYYTVHENAWVYTHPESLLETVFFDIWSKKEAIVKAIGKGLAIEFNTFDVLADNPVIFNGKAWHLTPLTLFDDCAAALATNSPSPKVSVFDAAGLL